MISIKSKHQPMSTIERIFVNPANSVYIQLAIETENTNLIPKFIEKIKNSFAGLYIKTDGYIFIPNLKNKESIKIINIPKEVKSLADCCDWIYKTYNPCPDYSLASLAADEKRIVVNSNHSLTDGGFFVNFLKCIQNTYEDEFFKQQIKIPENFRNNIFEEKFRQTNKISFQKYNKSDFTYLKKQENVELPDSYNKIVSRYRATINFSELSSSIYDKKLEKIKQMNEFLWTGLCMAINSANEEFGPIGLGTIMDFRRLLPQEKVTNSFGNIFTHFYLFIKNVNSRMTIDEICAKFREQLNQFRANDLFFYDQYLHPFNHRIQNCPISHVSNIGQIKIKSPIKNFFIQCSSNEMGLRSMLQVTSYSKIKNETKEKDLEICLRYSPLILSNQTAKEIFETYVYFLKNVDSSKSVGDVFDELLHFQKSLK